MYFPLKRSRGARRRGGQIRPAARGRRGAGGERRRDARQERQRRLRHTRRHAGQPDFSHPASAGACEEGAEGRKSAGTSWFIF